MTELGLAALVWLATHFGLSSTRARDLLVARTGEVVFLVLYSLISAAAITWLVMAWIDAPRDLWLWEPAPWQRWVPIAVMPFSVLLLVCALSAPNPTAVGQGGAMAAEDPARGILRVTRHPMLWALLLWALAHAVPNGDAATLVLVGTIGLTAALGMGLIDRKKARRDAHAWPHFAAVTSVVPFAAIAAGRNRLALGEIGIARPVVALVLFMGLWHGHPWFAGVSALPH